LKRFLAFACAVASAAALGACSGGSTNIITLPAPSPSPVPIQANQQVSGSPLAHVIVITMENRTTDNLFSVSALTGGKPYPGADAKPVGIGPDGVTPVAFTPVSLADYRDPGHAYPELVAEWNNGAMNGFANNNVYPLGASGPVKIANFANAFAPPNETILYHQLAYQYALADRMFSSRLVASFPGHQFLIAGQSGAADNPPTNVWGCDSPIGTLAPTFGAAETAGSGATPCYDYQTLGDLLSAANVSWKYYSGPPGTIDGNIDAYGAIRHVRFGADFAKIAMPITNLNSDLQNCTLPSVSYINAPAFASDHSATLSAGGPGFVADIYLQWIQTKFATAAACQYLNNTAIIVTWDDSGGWADHVAPPKDAAGASYGLRVPLIVISPYVKSGYTAAVPSGYLPFVSHVQHDYGSIIRFIEKNFGVTPGALGQRDAAADDLSDMFNYAQTPVPPIAGLLLSDFKRHSADAKRSVQSARRGMPVDDDK
jgi:phospholipase C